MERCAASVGPGVVATVGAGWLPARKYHVPPATAQIGCATSKPYWAAFPDAAPAQSAPPHRNSQERSSPDRRVASPESDLAQRPDHESGKGHRGYAVVLPEAEREIAIPLRIENRQSLFEMVASRDEFTREPMRAMRDARLTELRLPRAVAQHRSRQFAHGAEFAADEAAAPHAVLGGEALGDVLDAGRDIQRALERRRRLGRAIARATISALP